MDLRLVTVTLDPETGAFPEAPLEGIDGEIVSVVEHFFHHRDRPHLLLVVHCRPASAGRAGARRRDRDDPRRELGPEDAALYDRLRAWRNGRAQVEGAPSFVLFSNRQLAEIARRRPRSKAELREIRGIGEAKAGRYGTDVLRLIAEPIGAVEPARLDAREARGDDHGA